MAQAERAIGLIEEDKELSVPGQARAKRTATWLNGNRTSFICFAIFSLLISLSFFLEGLQTSFSSLSGDQYNFLAVCVKKDNPHLLQGDMIVGDPKNVKYYIPFFVDLIRLLSLPDHNYLRGLNILLLLTSLLYMWGWWMLFSIWGDKWTAAILAFLARGIMYPPGNELWGIAGLWTMLPRTLFLALLPWVLWVWFRYRGSMKGWLLASLFCGLIVNVHPISGVCLVGSLLLAELTWTFAESGALKLTANRVLSGGVLMGIGMLPYIWTYWQMLGSTKGINPDELYQAARMRIRPIFWDPTLYAALWLQPKWITLVLLPWVCCLFIPREERAKYWKHLLALGAFSFGCVMISILPFQVEAILKGIGFQARFAFQLVRDGKYLIIPSLMISALVCTMAAKYLTRALRHGRALVIAASIVIILLTFFSRYPVFDKVPILGDDVSRFLWPVEIAPSSGNGLTDDQVTEKQMDGLLHWIKSNTAEEAKFVGPRFIRAGALRPVIHDWAGAGMLIEGNPRAFIEAAKRERMLRAPEYKDPAQKGRLIASWGADYWVTDSLIPELHLAYADSGWFVYDLRDPFIRQPQSLSPSD